MARVISAEVLQSATTRRMVRIPFVRLSMMKRLAFEGRRGPVYRA
ncbi:MAG: hypothetical protein QW379_05090 [Thermoplasmata archaeon]